MKWTPMLDDLIEITNNDGTHFTVYGNEIVQPNVVAAILAYRRSLGAAGPDALRRPALNFSYDVSRLRYIATIEDGLAPPVFVASLTERQLAMAADPRALLQRWKITVGDCVELLVASDPALASETEPANPDVIPSRRIRFDPPPEKDSLNPGGAE